MIAIANYLYEIFWVLLLYVTLYYGIHIFMEKYAKFIKIVFLVDIKYFNYNNEFGNDLQHKLLHLLSSVATFALLAINPIVHTAIFMWFFFVDVTQINRLVLNLCVLQLLRNFNLMTRRWSGKVDLLLLFQLVYTSVNFWNRSILAPSMFFLVDEASSIQALIKDLKVAHDQLVGFDDKLSALLLKFIAWSEGRKRMLSWVRMLLLVLLLTFSLMFSSLSLWSEVVFYYWGAFRVSTIYNAIRK